MDGAVPLTKRERTEYLHPPFNIRLGRELGCNLMLIYVMALSFAVVSPIILPFTLLFFLENWVVWRYQMLYTFERSYESGGIVRAPFKTPPQRRPLYTPNL
jgi:Calcium-dependent channel, 7TM region, putative phosphate